MSFIPGAEAGRDYAELVRLRAGISEYIGRAVASGEVAPIDVPCPPPSEWAPPLPDPADLLRASPHTYPNPEIGLSIEFARVKLGMLMNLMPPPDPPSTRIIRT